jgi:hypothetical protein
MTTTPPDDPSTPPPASTGSTTGTTGTTTGSWLGSMPADARLPIPGNAEFGVYLVALILAGLVCWIANDLGSSAWLDFFQWTTIAYVLSRGIAKASRVLEQ